MDGWVVIGTKLDSKQLEKDLKSAERRLQQYEKEAEKLTSQKAKIDLELSEYEKQKQLIQESTDKTLKKAQTEEQVNNVLNMENIELEELKSKYSNIFQKQSDINKKIKQNTNYQELLNNEISEMNTKLSKTKGFDKIKNSIDDIGKSTTNTIKKVSKWALAIFGLRSAYMFVRKTASTISQYNEQIAADLEYMQFALASMLQPVIEKLIELSYTLLTYVNYIAQAWFGIDLFANASADAMKRASQSAEKMKKSLAGFDEMNVLNDNGTTGAMGTATPSMDLSAPENVEVPKWLIWIRDNGSLVASIITGIATALTALKLGLVAGPDVLILLAVVIQIVDMFQGLVKWVENLVGWLENPTWDDFVKFWRSGIESMGLVGDLILWIFDLFGGFEKVVEPLHNFYDWIKDTLIPNIGKFFCDLWKNIKEIFSPVIDFFVNIFETIWANIKTGIDNIKQIFSLLWQKIKEIFGPVVDFFKETFTNAWNKIKEVFSPIVDFFSGIWDKVKTKLKDFGAKVGEVISGAFKGVINGVLNAIENILNFPINSINKLIEVINAVPGINLGKLNTFKLPRLAVGGIVNMPGRGVPVGGAIAGEAGKEGVLPLTDSQTMEELGSAIGRYITINATLINQMNGRTISRELKKVQNESAFATNR